MRGRYSKLLINELVVVPDDNAENASTFLTRSDMALHGRSEAQWRALLGSVGFKVVGVWSAGVEVAVESEGIIECVLSGVGGRWCFVLRDMGPDDVLV